MKLYNFEFGPYPRRATIYVAEKGLENIEHIWMEAPSGKVVWPPASLKGLTPTMSLPILVDDDGTVVGQSLALLEYLEDTRPGPDMRGATMAARARTREFVTVLDDALTFFALWARHGSHLGQGKMRMSQDVAEICAARYFGQLRLIERMMGETAFIAGDSVSTADCVAMATLQYIDDFYDVPIPDDCPALSAWYARFSERPSAVKPVYPDALRATARGLMAQTRIER